MHAIDLIYNAQTIFVAVKTLMNPVIPLHDYLYDLPPQRIAYYPLKERDQSKLLVYRGGNIVHSQFHQLGSFLPDRSLLFFNDTRVIPARLMFQKDTGAEIEIFLLTPVNPVTLEEAMKTTGAVRWQCVIGNLKRWGDGTSLFRKLPEGTVEARLIDRTNNIVEFIFTPPGKSFAEMVQLFGITPLPPYIKREVMPEDPERYQTVYSHHAGAVAAPTAGLHFTDSMMAHLKEQGFAIDFLTLHVSAGTFLPVKVEDAADHRMHSEQVTVTEKNIENLLSGKRIIAVGTTSLRTLESLYWYGVKLLDDPDAKFEVNQEYPYQHPGSGPTKEAAFGAVRNLMQRRQITQLHGETSIYILPGYKFRVCQGLVTNFHQPGSTLLLLIAAFVGSDWKKIYEEALRNEYRFLSYGDSSLLMRNEIS